MTFRGDLTYASGPLEFICESFKTGMMPPPCKDYFTVDNNYRYSDGEWEVKEGTDS